MKYLIFIVLIYLPIIGFTLDLSIPHTTTSTFDTDLNSARKNFLDKNYRPNVISRITSCIDKSMPEIEEVKLYVLTLDITSDGYIKYLGIDNINDSDLNVVKGIILNCQPFGQFPNGSSASSEVYSISHQIHIEKRPGTRHNVRINYKK